MKISSKIIKQLGGSVRLSPNKHVNMLVVHDGIFEMEPIQLANPDHGFQEIPQLTPKGKGYRNVFEFLMWEQWSIVTHSDMMAVMDKIEAAISIEWHMHRGLKYTTKEMRESSKFAFSCTPYVPDEDNDWDQTPFLIKYLSKEQRYDIPELNLGAPFGTSIFMNSIDRITAGDMGDHLDQRF